MSENYPNLDLRSVLATLGRRAPHIIATVIIGFVLVYVWSSQGDKVYSSNAEVRFSPNPARVLVSEEDQKSDDVSLGNETYLITSSSVRQTVNTVVGPTISNQIRSIQVTRLPETDVLRITVNAGTPEAAKAAANAYAETYVDIRQSELSQSYVAQIERINRAIARMAEQITDIDQFLASDPSSSEAEVRRLERSTLIGQQSEYRQAAFELEFESTERAGTVRVIKAAGLPSLPLSPTPLRDAGVAAVLLATIAIGVAFLYEQLDTRLKNADQVAAVMGNIPVLGSVPDFSKRRFWQRGDVERKLVPTSSAAAEAYRAIGTGLRFSGLDKERQRILVTSTMPGEGKTTLAAHLALVLSEQGQRVLALSADLRHPRLAGMLGAPETEKGLTSLLLGDMSLPDVVTRVTLPGQHMVALLPSGPLPHEPGTLLGSDELGIILDKFHEAGTDFLLIDCAPVLPVSDALAATRHVDGVIVVVRAGRTTRQQLRETVERLSKVNSQIIGIVVNGVATRHSGAYQTGYGYVPDA